MKLETFISFSTSHLLFMLNPEGWAMGCHYGLVVLVGVTLLLTPGHGDINCKGIAGVAGHPGITGRDGKPGAKGEKGEAG